jgi:hypothetical protein
MRPIEATEGKCLLGEIKRNKPKTIIGSVFPSEAEVDGQNEMKERAKGRLPNLDVLLFLVEETLSRPTSFCL